jgi:TonB family protein
MRRTICSLAVLILAGSLAAQTKPASANAARGPLGDFDFAGATLRISNDSMTDRQTCIITTANSGGAFFLVNNGAVMVSSYGGVDYSAPASLRLGEAAPFRLSIPGRPGVLLVPFSKSTAVVHALYTQSRIRLRFYKWPQGLFDEELEIGDFAAAYDRGVELCAWPKLSAAAVHPARDLERLDATLGSGTASSDDPTNNSERGAADAGHAVSTQCIYCPEPEYPDEARRAGSHGTVLLEATVTSDGRLTGPVVLNKPGFGLEEKALAVIGNWKMRPLLGATGRPLNNRIRIEVAFREY